MHPTQQHNKEGMEIEERTFSWQEKVFSPFEISYYQYSGNCHTALEEKYHKDIVKLCHENTPNNRLFTYTNVDEFTDMEEVSLYESILVPYSESCLYWDPKKPEHLSISGSFLFYSYF